MLGRKTPIAVVPNGIDVPVLSGDSGGNSSPGIEHGLESRRYFLYLGRIHPFKGLAELVAGWSRSSAPDRGFALVIAGPCESRFEEWFKRLLRGARKPESLKYVGETKGEEKASFLAHARALILPSLSENFGIVVGEALVQQTPAIANFGAPWSLLVEEGCGWWIPYGEESLTAAIEEASKRPREEIEEMGRRGRLAVERRLSWPAIGTKMNEMYRWLSDGTPLPFWFTMGETP
jgi:glycosyltransferase involved in cell wall biosynthesis